MIKHFRSGVILRVLLLAGIMALFVYLLVETEYYVSVALLAGVTIYQILQLIRYVEQTNKKLTRFLNSIRYSDFSTSFSEKGMGKSFQVLNQAFSKVIERFKKERAEKQEHFRYLQTVVQHIGIGLISFNHKGDVELINTAAKRLFQISSLRNIKSLSSISEQLLEKMLALKGGNRTLLRLNVKNRTMQLAMYATEFKMRNEMYKLVSFQNIHNELEDKEMEAWENLTQVLSHEIMNSITPISSLSDTVYTLLEQNARKEDGYFFIDYETLGDVKGALNTINKRSHGLMRFVNSYRDFTQIPEPDTKQLSVKNILERARNLNKGEAKSQDVELEITVEPKSLEVTADPDLIEQVLINLIKNAFRALEHTEHPLIHLKGFIDNDGKVVIQVHDNGPGISPENQQKIFIPFYSTGKSALRGGSGIGLSLSRQIMRMHRGTLTVKSNPEKGTFFSLKF